jgi:D-arabinose 1-dehydrogenase-like Zn-dependent alcohol dehydrogenase
MVEPSPVIADNVAVDTMTVARFHEPGKPLRVEQVPVPRPAADEALVRMQVTGLCGSDVHIAVEGITPTLYRPIVLGHEIAGTIAALGDAVQEGWAIDDRVVVSCVVTDGTCPQSVAARSQLCANRSLIDIHQEGGLAERYSRPGVTCCAE